MPRPAKAKSPQAPKRQAPQAPKRKTARSPGPRTKKHSVVKYKQKPAAGSARPLTSYDHKATYRANNPPVGMVTPDTDPDLAAAQKTYSYDPHLDPQLQWAGKAEHLSFTVPTQSLHVHERIDPRTIIEAVRKNPASAEPQQLSLFASPTENPPLREAVEFYRHKHNWSNRLIAGDSLVVMNSLLEKEGMGGQVQMIYIDPPYGIKYGSNFQPFINKRDVKDGKDEDLTQEPEMVKAFRDTWELGIHSYLTYLRDRLLLARELLAESGSVFVQISDENVHLVRSLLDELFGVDNRVSQISFLRGGAQTSKTLAAVSDYLLWYARDVEKLKSRPVLLGDGGWAARSQDLWVEGADGMRSRLPASKTVPAGAKVFTHRSLESATGSEGSRFPIEYDGKVFTPKRGWSTSPEGVERLKQQKRLLAIGDTLRFVVYLTDYPVSTLTNNWTDTIESGFASDKIYVVQTATRVIGRCMLMTTDPGDLVLDPTCGSGTTAYVAEQWGRRWITCDTSRVALTLAKQRLMTALFDYYELARPEDGVDSGFKYKTVPHITLKSIANNEPPDQETLYDKPLIDNSKARVTGPFTVEAVPASTAVKPLSEIQAPPDVADESVSRSGETLRQAEWREELLRTGIRGKRGQKLEFTRVELLQGTRYLHADSETRVPSPSQGEGQGEVFPQRAVISFGSAFAPLEQRQVELAIDEALKLKPTPKLVVFAAFQFDPEAAKDIDETHWPGVTLLKAQMNADLLTDDLKKKRASNESFWLIGQPDVTLTQIKKGEHQGEYQVEVHGFDYYNTLQGTIESGGVQNIAIWLLDPDYDGRSLFPRQVFFPMSGEKDGWSRLAKNLKAELDPDLIEQYRGTVSLPFSPGPHKQIAVKIVDDRGIESLKLTNIE